MRFRPFEKRLEFLGFLPQILRLAHQLLLLEGALHQAEQLLGGVRFADEVERAELDGFDGVAQRILPSEHDGRQVRRAAFDFGEHFETAGVRQTDVQ